MCLAVVSWNPDDNFPIKIIANRDEFRKRPAEPMHWWGNEDILAGKDTQAGGTWLGFNRNKNFALLTNIRPGFIQKKGELSRGDLVKNFLTGSLSIQDFHKKHRNNLDQYGGFNLILGSIDGLFWFSSVKPEGRWLAPNTYGLSNDSLDTPWPKTLLAKQQMNEFGNSLTSDLTGHPILGSQREADHDQLPSTGVPLEWESKLSAQTIIGADYGTRCRTHFIASNKNVFNVAEQQINEIGDVVSTNYFKIQ